MFRVVQHEMDFNCFTERTMFRSGSVQDCWDYVKARIRVANFSGHEIPRLYVRDKIDQFIDEPAEIVALRRCALVA